MDLPDYDPQLDSPPLSDDELQALDDLLCALPGDAVMNVEALDGYLTALLVGPPGLRALRSADWMPAIWGGGSPFPSHKQHKRAAVLVLRHLHAIDRKLATAPDDWEPVLSVAETAEGEERIDAEDWCAGFLQAVPLDAEGWARLFDDPELGPLLVPMAVLGSEDSAQAPADPQARDELSRAAIEAVPALLSRGS